METILIRKLDPAIKVRLRIRAAEHGHSMEEEAREILRVALTAPEPPREQSLAAAIRELVEPLGGIELDIPSRTGPGRPVPTFD